MRLYLTSAEVLQWTGRLLAVYVVIDSSEKLYLTKEYTGNGLFSWALLKKNSFFTRRPAFVQGLLDIIFEMPVWVGLMILRLLCGAFILFFPFKEVTTVYCFSALFFVGSLINFRNIAYGAETENRFSLMIILALLLQKIAPTHLVTMAVFWFIALQACLSYLTAGIAKLFNTNWRHGEGFIHIVGSYNLVPLKGVGLFFSRHYQASKFINWWVIIFECFFPLVMVIGRPYCWIFLALGIIFHASIAICLRLGKFFWVWIATYPVLIFITQ